MREKQNLGYCTTGAYLVLAGPGTGKTYTVIHRIENLVKYEQVEPSKAFITKIDRIEKTDDGNYQIYDYKTGKPKDSHLIIDNIHVFLGGMLSGQHPMDNASKSRLVKEIRHILKLDYGIYGN